MGDHDIAQNCSNNIGPDNLVDSVATPHLAILASSWLSAVRFSNLWSGSPSHTAGVLMGSSFPIRQLVFYFWGVMLLPMCY